MAKGYMVADLHVRDKAGLEKFREMAKPVLEEYGGKVLVRTPSAEARDKMIAGLDTVRPLLEEISPELGVTDSVSGSAIMEI
jgi:hypothetical protein